MKKFYQKSVLSLSSFLLAMLFSVAASATIYPFHNNISGTQEVPANASPGKGVIVGSYNDETHIISYTIIFGSLTANVTAAHFHAPALPGVNAPVIIGHVGFPTGVTAGSYTSSNLLTASQETQLIGGLMYLNIHSTVLPGGEIRAQLQLSNPGAIYIFNNIYSGMQEVPANASPATGRIIGSYNPTTNTISYGEIFSGLSANASASHFHAPAPVGVNAGVFITKTAFPASTSATYFNSHVVTDVVRQNQLLSNLWYSNIHNSVFPGGELRAQIILNIPSGITCPANVTVANGAGQCSQSVAFGATATGNPAPAITYSIGGNVITSPHRFQVGTTTVTASATNAAGTATCTFTVRVNDTEAPVISNMSATPNNLWQPNHKMHPVTVNYNSSDNCPGTSCQLTVTSNEAVNGNGDGNTEVDWVVVDDHHVMLRAERSGKGSGRIYTIRATCTDAAGNSSSSTTTVSVAHDKRAAKNTVAVVEAKNALGELSMKAWPNPARNYFILNIETAMRTDKVQVQIVDIAGRVVEVKQNIIGSQTLRVGSGLKAGVYFVRIIQGNETLQMKLMKME